MEQSAVQLKQIADQLLGGFMGKIFDKLGDLAPVGAAIGVAVLLYLFDDKILHGNRIAVATILLIVGISLLSWMRPPEDFDDTEIGEV